MQRREFLYFSLAPLIPALQNPAIGPRDRAWKSLIADLEKEIVELMNEAQVPGLSIAILSDGIMTNSEDKGYLEVIAKLIAGDNLSRVIGGKLRDSPS